MSEVRETRVGIEVGHFDVVRRARGAEFPARRLHRAQVSRGETEIDLSRGCTAEALVRSVGVVRESSIDNHVSPLALKLGRQKAKEQGFERAQESFQLGVGAMVFRGTEPKPDAPGFDLFLETVRGEFAAAIGDEVSRSSESAEGVLDEADHGPRVRRTHELMRGDGYSSNERWCRARFGEGEIAQAGFWGPPVFGALVILSFSGVRPAVGAQASCGDASGT